MLHYSDIYKISNYKIIMENLSKIKELKDKINSLQNLVEDFVDLHHSKKNKIINLETEIEDIKEKMHKYLDNLEEIIKDK